MSRKHLIPQNIPVNDDRIVGLLNGGDFGPADPALDLVAAWQLLNSRGRNRLRRRLGCSEEQLRM